MLTSLAEFVALYLGDRVTAIGGLGGECVDLVNLWLDAKRLPMVRKNAVDWPQIRQLGTVPFTGNSTVNYPQPGAIVVWHGNVPSRGVGPYGHIAVNLTADPMHLVTVDQNWPEGAPVSVRVHDYLGVQGWFNVRG